MWNIASKPIWNRNEDYISKNGTLYNSVNSLGDEYTQYKSNITDKIKSQFGNVDVLSAKLNNGYVNVTILDTYDFNPNESNPLVQMGYSVQKANLLYPYYTIVKCRYKI